MISRIVGISLKLRLLIFAAAALMLFFGMVQFDDMPLDILPEFTRPYVELQTEALGLSAQEMEAFITTPLEADMLNGTPWAVEIRSVSIPGLSSIVLTFEKGTDIMRARQVVQERLVELFALPNVSQPTTMINPVSSASRCMVIGLTSDKLSLIEMSVLARWTILPRLMGLPGVANVSIWGERERQLQVLVDPEQLKNENVTLSQIIKTTGNALWASPLSFLEASTPGTGGWVETPNQRLGVRHLLPITTAEELAQVTVEGANAKRLGDVATVVEDHQPLIGDAIVDNGHSLMLVVEKFPWANVEEVTEEVEEALAALRPGLSGMKIDPTLFRQATFLELAADNLTLALSIGAVLMMVALFAFLYNWRMVLISAVTIVISVFAAITVIYVMGAEINLIVIAGLVIALGVIIDDAVIDIENITRRFRQARKEGKRESAAITIVKAAVEMRRPIVYATLVMAAIVVPAMFLEGLSGAFWKPLVTTYLLAALASMAVAMTLTPALCLLFFRKASLQSDHSPLWQWLQHSCRGMLSRAINSPRLVLFASGLLVLVGLVSLTFFRQESLLPNLRELDLVVRWQGSPSASHPSMSRITNRLIGELRSIPGVREASAQVGRAIMSDKRTNINAGELWVSIDTTADYDATQAAIEKVIAGYPGLSPEILTYLRAKFRDELSGTGESHIVRVYGEDINIIRKKAEEVKQVLSKISGIADTKVHHPLEVPTLEIEVNIENAKRYGLKPGDVRRAATALVAGIEAGSLFEEQKVFDVVVWGKPEIRHSLSSIQNLVIDTPAGDHARLQEVADVRIVPAPAIIHRDAAARIIDVTANVHGRDLAAVAAEIKRGIREIDFPLEYRAELLGESAELLAAQRRVLTYAIAAAIGIFLLLQVFFRSWHLATATFLTMPVAGLGGVLAILLISGGTISFGSIIGFILVFGITVRSVITLVSRYQHLEEHDGETFSAELVERATLERLAPILTVTALTGLVFLPFAVLGNIAGLEIIQPMAIVILGGLITSTLYTMFGVPSLYLRFGFSREPDLGLLPNSAVTAEEMLDLTGSTGDINEEKVA